MQLVDEQDDLSCRVLDLLEHGLEPLLELAAVFGPGNQRAQVERDNALVLQAFGHVAAHDALGEPFDDGGLAHARLADQHGVVLRPPAQNLDDATDLFVTADDGVELAVARVAGKVAAVLLQRLVSALRVLRRYVLAAADLGQRGQDLLLARTRVIKDALSVAAQFSRGDEQVLCRNVFVGEALGLVLCAFQQLTRARIDRHLATGNARAPAEHGCELDAYLGGIRPKLTQRRGRDAFRVCQQRGQDVFRVEDGAVLVSGQALGGKDRLLRLLGVVLEMHVCLACPVCGQFPSVLRAAAGHGWRGSG